MIGSVKSEWRKLSRRPAYLVSTGLVVAVTVLVYAVNYHQFTWPSAANAAQAALDKQTLYPANFVLNVIGASFPLGAAALSLAGWVTGDYLRGRRTFVAGLEARARALAAEVDDARRLAAEEERLRIARELHDVVAHNVSVIAIQAGAARMAAGAGETATKAMESIEVTARDTLAELNRLLGVLRKMEPRRRGRPSRDWIRSMLC